MTNNIFKNYKFMLKTVCKTSASRVCLNTFFTVIHDKGNTNLGADDKVGIAVVVTAVEKIIRDKIPTSDIYFAFVSDEEIGVGASRLDYAKYKVDYFSDMLTSVNILVSLMSQTMIVKG